MTTTDNERYVDYLDFSDFSWQRPEGPTRVWRVVNGRRKTPDGEIEKFSIQEVPKGLEDEVIDFMVTHLFADEPVQFDLGTGNDPLAVREFRTLWRDVLLQGISVVALKMNSDPTVKPVLVGANMLSILTMEDEATFDGLTKFRSEPMVRGISPQLKLMDEANVLKRYGVDKYLTACGLCVHPSFRGQGLGEALLRARDDISLAYQIPASETVFTATVSQILAARVGHEVLVERKYSELLDDEGKVAFPGVTVEFMKVMGKKFY